LRRALIFGASGQDGFYLARLLETHDVSPVGISRGGGRFVQGDVSDYGFVASMLQQYEPDYIFHLAADSTVQHEAMFANHETVGTGTLNILESARLHAPQARIFLAASALQFVNTGKPIDESTPFESNSPYSLARIHSTYAARYFRSAFGLRAYVGYFFNHDSPLRPPRHINQRIVQAARRIARGSSETLEIGDVDVRKEFNHAFDLVQATWILVNQDEVFEAVLGSGRAYRIRDWLDICFAIAGIDWTKHVEPVKGFTRGYDVLVSNPARLVGLGWQPRYTIEGLAQDMMAHEGTDGVARQT
jgi:GDPmannose 4,6-dehydratase